MTEKPTFPWPFPITESKITTSGTPGSWREAKEVEQIEKGSARWRSERLRGK